MNNELKELRILQVMQNGQVSRSVAKRIVERVIANQIALDDQSERANKIVATNRNVTC